MREELLFAIQKIVKKYSVLKDSSYEDTIERIVLLQSENVCSVHFEDADLKQLWLGL